MTPVVYAFCREAGERFKPSVGRGASQQHRQWYNRPTKTGALVKHLGEGLHINRPLAEKLQLCEVDADYWKTWVHQRLSTPIGQAGAMTFYSAPPQEHLALAKHLTAERKTEEFVAGKGVVAKWERLRRQNHWFDALYNACAAGHLCGVRLVNEPKPEPPQRKPLAELMRCAGGR
jgi:Terminase large subunit gpA, endonuclease domain